MENDNKEFLEELRFLARELQLLNPRKAGANIRTSVIYGSRKLKDIEKLVCELACEIEKRGVDKKIEIASQSLSEILTADKGKFKGKLYGGFLARYLETQNNLENTILLIPADIQNISAREVYGFGLEIVENEPDLKLQELCAEKNLILLFVLSVNDYTKYRIQLHSMAPGVRDMSKHDLSDKEYDPPNHLKVEWGKEVENLR